MPKNTTVFWKEDRRDDELVARHNTATAVMGDYRWTFHQYDVPGRTGILHLHMPRGSYQYYFILRGYDYEQGSRKIGIDPGDVIINGGGCWGETDILFADRSAPGGRVFSFEFVEDNLKVMRQNMAANPELARRVELVRNALSDRSGEVCEFAAQGPGTRVECSGVARTGGERVTTLSVDDLVAQRRLERVNFIKLDIEGSELQALRGAEQTLRQFRPKLALSAYHRPEDLYALSTYLDSLDVNYKFYMDHFTVHQWETVLFAVCDEASAASVPSWSGEELDVAPRSVV
jgi:FkbM family methyltransferase